MHPYIEINAHHIGKSHSANGLSCEDYSITYSDDFVSIVAISDGHGDKNCFRSALGARFACEIAVSECRRFRQSTDHIEQIGECDFEDLVKSLESDIADRWREKTLVDAEHHPFSEDELSGASQQARESYKNGSRLEKAYGCTLIMAMITKSYWLAVQIGDGKCVAAYPDGAFVEPISADENCLGNRSTSLCNSNAKDSFRHYYNSAKPLAVFVSSDGIEESFDQAGLYNCFYSVGYWLKECGVEVTGRKLEELLPQISEGGSGDDVSIAAMASLESLLVKPRQSLEQVYEKVSSCSDAFEQCTAQLADARARLASLEEQYDFIEIEIVELKEKLAEKEELFNAVAKEKEAIDADVDELSQREQKAAEQMEKAESFKVSAEDFWFPRLVIIGLEHQIEIDGEPLKETETDISDKEDFENAEAEPAKIPADASGNVGSEEKLTAVGSEDSSPGNTGNDLKAVDGDELEMEIGSSALENMPQTKPHSEEAETSGTKEQASILQMPKITADDVKRDRHTEPMTCYSDILRGAPRKAELSDYSVAPVDEDQLHIEKGGRRRWPLAKFDRR